MLAKLLDHKLAATNLLFLAAEIGRAPKTQLLSRETNRAIRLWSQRGSDSNRTQPRSLPQGLNALNWDQSENRDTIPRLFVASDAT
jgi:hypothetical protein